VILRGDFFPADAESAPAVAMSAGLTLLKEHAVGALARQFQAAGISALAYDHRSFGSSDGEPRQETNPVQHAEDYHDAVHTVANLPGVDPDRVAIWGVGHSACWVMMAAADHNPRIKAAVFQRPIYSGAIGAENFPLQALAQLWPDRESRIADASPEPTYIKAWPESLENAQGHGDPAVVAGVDAYHLVTGALPSSEAAGTPWENKVTLRSLHYLIRTEAQDYLPRVTIPALYVLAEDDPFGTPLAWQREAFSRMAANGELLVTPSSERTMFEQFGDETDAVIKFFSRVL
jgi:uncharacterized protein